VTPCCSHLAIVLGCTPRVRATKVRVYMCLTMCGMLATAYLARPAALHMSETSISYDWTVGASFEEFMRRFPPSSGWIWGSADSRSGGRGIAYVLDRNQRYIVNSSTPGFFLAVGVNTVCPVSSWDPGWGRDRILLTHVQSLESWWGQRVWSIGHARFENAGNAAAHLVTDC
jgi:hypothetical protein